MCKEAASIGFLSLKRHWKGGIYLGVHIWILDDHNLRQALYGPGKALIRHLHYLIGFSTRHF